MKILAIADMHGSARAFREMKEKSRQADLIINAGDFSIFEQNIEQFFAKMDKL
ncbi:MAG: metallophosphoesterase family protein, partial [Nanoarchaeota archaeon]|nr:metallophosphoesterase family protein [Nanoarchaeota archaeon]